MKIERELVWKPKKKVEGEISNKESLMERERGWEGPTKKESRKKDRGGVYMMKKKKKVGKKSGVGNFYAFSVQTA